MEFLKIWYVLGNFISHNSHYYLKVLNLTAVTKLLCQLHFNQILQVPSKVFCHYGQLWFYSDAFAKMLPL